MHARWARIVRFEERLRASASLQLRTLTLISTSLAEIIANCRALTDIMTFARLGQSR